MHKTKGIFKVEIRKTCKVCGGKITEKKFRTFCCKKHRDKFNNKKYNNARTIWHRAKCDKEAEIPSANKCQCLLCDRWYVQVGSHIYNRHNMTAREYREMMNLEVKRGIVPDWYRKLKGEQAIDNGTFKNLLVKGKKFWFKKNQQGLGKYKRSPITLARIAALGKRTWKLNNQKIKHKI